MEDHLDIGAGADKPLDLIAIRKDARNLLYFSDGSSGSDKILRLLAQIIPLTVEVERLRAENKSLRTTGNGRNEALPR
jgi:hypothetical protein